MTTTVARLLAHKQELLRRIERDPGPNERAEIESMLAKIDTALNLIDDLDLGNTTGLVRKAEGSPTPNFAIEPLRSLLHRTKNIFGDEH